MKFTILPVLATLLSLGAADTVSYDPGYDISSRPLTELACSDGPNGLITKHGWHTLGQIKRFPHIGGAASVAGWNSPQCGVCYRLEYKGKKINVLAVDHAAQGFNIAKKAMDELTGGKAVQLGRVDAKATRVASKDCGL